MAGIWSVRGVSPDLQRKVAEQARREGMTVGAWLSRAAETALDAADEQAVDDAVQAASTRLAIRDLQQRMTALEQATTPAPPAKPPQAGPDDTPPPVQPPAKGKHPQPDEIAFMLWHFQRHGQKEADQRIRAVTGRAASMINKYRAMWKAGDLS